MINRNMKLNHYAGFNVGGADWPRPELQNLSEESQFLEQLTCVGYREAKLALAMGANMLRMDVASRSLNLFDDPIVKLLYELSEPIYLVPVEKHINYLDQMNDCLNTLCAEIDLGLVHFQKRLKWERYDAYLRGVHQLNEELDNSSNGIRILMIINDHPPRIIVEAPNSSTLIHLGRKYDYSSLWMQYQKVFCAMARVIVQRYGWDYQNDSERSLIPVVSAIEVINEPDYNWLPDEVRIERSKNPGASPCDKYVTELHLSQIPINDLANKAYSITPWGYKQQELDDRCSIKTTSLSEFRWGEKFDWYVSCLADFHEKISFAVKDEAVKGGCPIVVVSGSVTHNNVDWLTRMYKANPNTFKYVDKIGIHPYHWPMHDIWDTHFVREEHDVDWQTSNPRDYASRIFKRFDFLEQISDLTQSHNDAASFGLKNKKIWITEFGIPTKKLCEVNYPARENQRLFIYSRNEPVPDGISAIVWEDKWDAFFSQVSDEYLRRNNIEAFLVYTLREGITSEANDNNHSNFAIFTSKDQSRLAQSTLIKLQNLYRKFTAKAEQEAAAMDSNDLESLLGMTSKQEREYLENYARNVYEGKGEIVDLGSWLGSLTISILKGVNQNQAALASKYMVHAYDLFQWMEWMNPYQIGGLLKEPLEAGDSFLPEFVRRVMPWDKNSKLLIYAGDLCKIGWSGKRIELLVVDVMKSWDLANSAFNDFFPYLMPGQSYVFHQDFCHFFETWIHLIHYRFREYFEMVYAVPDSATMVFKYIKEIPKDAFGQVYSFSTFSDEEIVNAFDFSLSLLGEEHPLKRESIMAAKVMAFIQKGDASRARLELEKILATGYRIMGELGTVEALLAEENGKETGQEHTQPVQNSIDKISLIKELHRSRLIEGQRNQLAIWDVTINTKTNKAIFLHPKAALSVVIPRTDAGNFTFAIAVHPAAWDKPESGRCRFIIRTEQGTIFDKIIDPHNPEQQKWNDFSLYLPAVVENHREIIFETDFGGKEGAYCWALWKNPEIVFDDVDIREIDESSIEDLLKTADQAFLNENYCKSLKYLGQALDLEPDNPQIINAYGNVFLKQGNLDSAYQQFKMSTMLAPNFAPGFVNSAVIKLLKGEKEEAFNYANQAIILDPDDENAQQIMALLEPDMAPDSKDAL
jgi:tetratricopeptide (TPR) repeat protein